MKGAQDTTEDIRILILEDSEPDQEFILHELRKLPGGYTHQIIESREQFENALLGFNPDIILSDYNLPQFTGLEALQLTRKYSEILPFIIITGRINEETAVQCMKEGATDYILKDRLSRLIPAIQNAFKLVKETKERQLYQQQLIQKNREYEHLNAKLVEKNHELNDLVQELKVAKEKAEESARLISAFLSNISHEIRTPMNGIMGFVELIISDEFSQQEKTGFANTILSCNKRLLSIITDIVDISTLQSSHLDLNLMTSSVKEILEQVFDNQGDLYRRDYNPETEIILNTNYLGGDLQIETDVDRLIRIINELLNNALENTEQGKIEIGVRNEPEGVLFYVKDTGQGISPQDMPKIWEPFQQVTNQNQYNAGLGIGLSIARSVVELLGGKIWIDSALGVGTTVYILHPIVQVARTPELKFGGASSTIDLHDKTILIVDDHEAMRLYLKESLRKTNVTCVLASTGLEAIDMVRSIQDIDCVLMDIQLPDMSGYESTREIKKINPQVKVIAQTAYAMSENYSKALDEGCDDYITKPINQRLLLKTLGRFLTSESIV